MGRGRKGLPAGCGAAPALSGPQSEAVEPTSLAYLEAEEEEELLSFHACKTQRRKALAGDILSS